MQRYPFLKPFCAMMLCVAAAAQAAEVYVDFNAAGAEQGTQQNPFRTVQAGIDAAADGDEIRVAAGTYVENLRIEGKAILLQGGYSSDWVRDLDSNTTTLSGAGGNAVINLIEADATIDGFRITGGTGSTEQAPFGFHGGGIYSRDGSPVISNNTIEANDVRTGEPPFDFNFGGGVYISNAAATTIINNIIRANFAGRGAGIAVVGQEALIQGNTIEDNVSVGDHGGGLFIAVVDATITQNVIRRNEVGRDLGYGWGGGLIVVNSGNSAELSFNEVYENFAAAYGSGEFIDEGAVADIHHELIYRNVSKEGCEAVSAISVDGGDGVGSQATISHCTVVNNVCPNATRGNGLQVEGLSSVSVINSIFWNNGGDDFAVDPTSMLRVTFTDSEEPFAGAGNISVDPLFVDEAGDDYRLVSASPAIDAGDPAAPFENEPADNGGRADMGRYGNAAPEGPSDDGGDDDMGDGGEDPDDPGPDDGDPGDDGDDGDDGGDDNGPDDEPADDSDNEGEEGPGDDAGDGEDSPGGGGSRSGSGAGSAACPSAAAMLITIPLVGAGLARRRYRR